MIFGHEMVICFIFGKKIVFYERRESFAFNLGPSYIYVRVVRAFGVPNFIV